MNFELDHDLTAWADGSLSREDLLTLHGQEARGLVALHERLLGAAEMAAPDPVAGWALLQRAMDAKVVPIRSRPRPRLRRAVLAVAAALLIGGGAFAAIGGDAVDHPAVLTPPAGVAPASKDAPLEQSPGQVGRSSGVTDGSAGPISSSAPSVGSEDPTQGSTGSGDTGDSTSGTDSGSGSGGTETPDPDGQHPGQGNGGEDNGNDGPRGHGEASSMSSHA